MRDILGRFKKGDTSWLGRKLSKETKEKMSISKIGSKNPNWKGGITKSCAGIDPKIYNSIHDWLRKNFGKANRCENLKCLNISKNYTWAKLKGAAYEKKRENFIQLCLGIGATAMADNNVKSMAFAGMWRPNSAIL